MEIKLHTLGIDSIYWKKMVTVLSKVYTSVSSCFNAADVH